MNESPAETISADAPRLPDWPAAMSKELTASYIGMSPRWIDQAVSTGTFPRPLKLGRASRWVRSAVDAWLAGRYAE